MLGRPIVSSAASMAAWLEVVASRLATGTRTVIGLPLVSRPLRSSTRAMNVASVPSIGTDAVISRPAVVATSRPCPIGIDSSRATRGPFCVRAVPSSTPVSETVSIQSSIAASLAVGDALSVGQAGDEQCCADRLLGGGYLGAELVEPGKCAGDVLGNVWQAERDTDRVGDQVGAPAVGRRASDHRVRSDCRSRLPW